MYKRFQFSIIHKKREKCHCLKENLTLHGQFAIKLDDISTAFVDSVTSHLISRQAPFIQTLFGIAPLLFFIFYFVRKTFTRTFITRAYYKIYF